MYIKKEGGKAADIIALLLSVSFPEELSGEKWVESLKSKDITE